MQFIREGRIGPYKSGKTKNVLESYPKPLLLLNFDVQGYTCVDPKLLTFIKADEWLQTKSDWKPTTDITVIDYSTVVPKLTLTPFRAYEQGTGMSLLLDVNKLFDFCPFKTVVIDSFTGLNDVMLRFVCSINKITYIDQGSWGQISGKSLEIINYICASLQAHFVLVMHEHFEKAELTGEIRILPAAYGKSREEVGKIVSQLFYSTVETQANGQAKYQVRTRDFGLIKGLGARFPQGLPEVCPASFEGIYGTNGNKLI